MIYGVYNTMSVGRPIEKIIDGDGNEYGTDSLRVDTETGLYTRYKRDSNGEQIILNGEFVREVLMLKLPIRIVWKDVKEIGPED